jgi:hypothetical protein
MTPMLSGEAITRGTVVDRYVVLRGDLAGSAAMRERSTAIFAQLHADDRPGVDSCRDELAETHRQAGQRSVTASRGAPP